MKKTKKTMKKRRERLTSQNAASAPDAPKSSQEPITAVGGHGGLGDLERLAQGGDLEHVETGAQQQVGKLDGLLLQLLRFCAGRGRRDGRSDGGRVGDHDCFGDYRKRGPDQGNRVLLRRKGKIVRNYVVCSFAKQEWEDGGKKGSKSGREPRDGELGGFITSGGLGTKCKCERAV